MGLKGAFFFGREESVYIRRDYMRKRIVIFASGWGGEYLREVVAGVFQVAKEENMDLFSFVNFSSISETKQYNSMEMNIFRLPDLRDFDGAILMAKSFNMEEEKRYVYEKVLEAGIPTISVDYEYEGITSINTDNYYGMFELTNHVIQKHGVRNIVFMGGPQGHLESEIRLQAVQDLAHENGMSIPQENILHGDWVMDKAKAEVEGWLSSNKQLPHAFICANDVMAIGICDFLKEQGYRIPEDVIVTGYDGIEPGKVYDPVIASVSHEWYSMGIMTMKTLLNKIEGKEDVSLETMKTRFVPGESCGCHLDKTQNSIKLKNSNNRIFQRYEAWACDTHFRNIYLAVRKAEDISTLHHRLNDFFVSENWMEGKDFMLCLEPEYFNIEDEDENLPVKGYSNKMDVICSLKDGVARPHEILTLKKAMFRVAQEKQEPGMYMFVPLSSEGKSYGFAMITRDMDIILGNGLYIWTRHVNQYLEQVRRNLTIVDLMKKLTNLSITDTLTGVYNRAGCEKITYPMLEEYRKLGKTGVVMLADIDRMKRINDEYGHESGDLALCIVARVLREQIPCEWIVARFGGDEFFIGGEVMPSMVLDAMIADITKKLEEEAKRCHIKFDLKISIGYKIITPDSELSVEKSLQKADALMYDVKKCHHEEANRNR